MSSAFNSEANHLSCILIFFSLTYLLRFCSDQWIIPRLQTEEHLVPCTLDGQTTICVNTEFILYYLWTSLLFDFAPIIVIIYFHHKSFKKDTRRNFDGHSSMVASSERETENMSPCNDERPELRPTDGSDMQEVMMMDRVNFGSEENALISRSSAVNSSSLVKSLVAVPGASDDSEKSL